MPFDIAPYIQQMQSRGTLINDVHDCYLDWENVSLNRWVFRALMKVDTVLVVLRDGGSVFRNAGVEQLKALVPNVWVWTFLVFRR